MLGIAGNSFFAPVAMLCLLHAHLPEGSTPQIALRCCVITVLLTVFLGAEHTGPVCGFGLYGPQLPCSPQSALPAITTTAEALPQKQSVPLFSGIVQANGFRAPTEALLCLPAIQVVGTSLIWGLAFS